MTNPREPVAYHFEFPALWLGGNAVIVAWSEEDARRELDVQLLTNKIEREDGFEITLRKATPIAGATTVFFDNGDY